MKNAKKKPKNMPVKLCRKCGAVNSVLKDCCENCNSALSEPMKKQLSVIESEIIYIENIRKKKELGQFCFDQRVDINRLNLGMSLGRLRGNWAKIDSIPAAYGRAYHSVSIVFPPEGTHFPKLRLRYLRLRLKRLKRKQRRYMQ